VGEKNSFIGEAVLELSVWQLKQFTTAHEAVVSCAKHALRIVAKRHKEKNVSKSLESTHFRTSTEKQPKPSFS